MKTLATVKPDGRVNHIVHISQDSSHFVESSKPIDGAHTIALEDLFLMRNFWFSWFVARKLWLETGSPHLWHAVCSRSEVSTEGVDGTSAAAC